MIDHCVSAFSEKQRQKHLNTYVTDCLHAIAENTMHFIGRDGVVEYGRKLTERWIDLAESKKVTKKKDRNESKSTEQLVDEMWSRIFRNGGES